MKKEPIGYSETSVSTANLRRVKSQNSEGLNGSDGYTSALCSKTVAEEKNSKIHNWVWAG